MLAVSTQVILGEIAIRINRSRKADRHPSPAWWTHPTAAWKEKPGERRRMEFLVPDTFKL